MKSVRRFEIGVAAGAALAIAGCASEPSTASRSAAAYDEAQRQGVPLAEGGGHDHHAPASPAAGTPVAATDGSHSGHGEAMPPQRGTAAMDHAAMGHERGASAGNSAAGHAGTRHAGTDHARAGHAAVGHAGLGRAAADHAAAGHTAAGHTAAGHAGAGHPSMDHAAMGHAAPPPSEAGHAASHPPAVTGHAAMGHAAAAPAPSPEAGSKMAVPGQPAETLRADALDAPAATAVEDAARAREAASSGHAMGHGTYRQVDAGRDDVPVSSPLGHQGRGSAATPAADPHAGHVMPAPRPSPSPLPKENR
jgi:hypothetical protein